MVIFVYMFASPFESVRDPKPPLAWSNPPAPLPAGLGHALG